MRHTTRTAATLLAMAVAAAGCGDRATGPADEPARPSPVSVQRATTSTVAASEVSEVAAPVDLQGAEPTVTTTRGTVPDVAVEDIESMLGDLEDTLAELDQLLNQTTAALAAEEGEIIP